MVTHLAQHDPIGLLVVLLLGVAAGAFLRGLWGHDQ